MIDLGRIELLVNEIFLLRPQPLHPHGHRRRLDNRAAVKVAVALASRAI